jgi:hypothetical protein
MRHLAVRTDPIFILDAQALSLLVDSNRRMMSILDVAVGEGFAPVLSAVTIAEQHREGAAAKRLSWLRSRLTIIGITEEVADHAAALLEETGSSGHECVVDALVVAVTLRGNAPAKVASSDGSHIPALCKAASRVRSVPVSWVRV